MIAVDTSSMVAYFKNDPGLDVEALEQELANKQLILPPVVLTELLSNPSLPDDLKNLILKLPSIELHETYWKDAGLLRKKLLIKGLKAKLGDALVAQACLENDLALLTRDDDFRHYEKYFHLKLVKFQ